MERISVISRGIIPRRVRFQSEPTTPTQGSDSSSTGKDGVDVEADPGPASGTTGTQGYR